MLAAKGGRGASFHWEEAEHAVNAEDQFILGEPHGDIRKDRKKTPGISKPNDFGCRGPAMPRNGQQTVDRRAATISQRRRY
jgi:hypothetical protein